MATITYEQLTNPLKPFIIAEIGSNHMGSMETAKQLIDAAKEAGCDAVKFQSWQWDTLEGKKVFESKKDYSRPGFNITGYKEIKQLLALTPEQHHELKNYCDQKGIIFSSSAYSKEQIDLLVNLDVPFLKFSSADIVHHELLKYAATKGKPIILATGMADIHEIDEALKVIREAGNPEVVLLHCVSQYPTASTDVNLYNIPLLKTTFGVPVGFSDHTLSTDIPVSSIALGANVIEKHFRLQNQDCREQKVSIEPDAMKRLVEGAREVAQSLGSKKREISESELKARVEMRRSVVVAKDLPAGHILTQNDLAFKRPGSGVAPKNWKYLIGRKLNSGKEEGDLVLLKDLG